MRRVLTAILFATLFCTPAFAVSRHWTGVVSANWSEAANWEPAGVPTAADDLQFPGWPVRRDLHFDLPAWTSVGPMSFLADYSISGNPMTLTGDLGFTSDPSAVPVTFNTDLKLGNAVRFWGPYQLTINGAIDINGKTLRMGTTYSTILNGPIAGSGTFIIDPRGVWLIGGGTFSGLIEGNAFVTGSYPSATFQSPWLTGSGTTGATTVQALSPGEWQPSLYHDPHTAGMMRSGPLSITSQYSVDLVPGGSSDRVEVTGSVSIAGTLAITIPSGTSPLPGESFTIIDNDGVDAVSGAFAGLSEGSTINTGSPTLTISYRGGDGNDIVLTAAGNRTTTTGVTQDRVTSEEFQPVTFTATVIAIGGVPIGSVSFFDGSVNLGSSSLVNGVAELTVKRLSIGTHDISAIYAGSDGFDASSAHITHKVVKGDPNVSLTSASSTITYGDPVSLSVAVAPNGSAGTPGGAVTIEVDGVAVATTTLAANGIAAIIVPLMDAGVHTIVAHYSGDAHFNAAMASTSQTVLKASTAVALDSLANPSPVGLPVTVAIEVSPTEHPWMAVGGNVVVSNGGQTVTEAQLIRGAAAVRVGPLTGGEYTISVKYAGNENFRPATATLTQRVAQPAIVIQTPVIAEQSATHDVLVRVAITEASASPATVEYRTVDGTATANADYLESQGTIVFNPGEKLATIPIRILGDDTIEPDETFTIELTNAVGAAVAEDRATLVITNDDLSYRPGVAYAIATNDGATVQATFYAPAVTNGPWPVILSIPGDSAYDAASGEVAALRETARGYAVLQVTYRPSTAAPFPAQILDLMAAVRWLRANAVTLSVDPTRVVAWGSGTGGHLAALLGTGFTGVDAATRVQAVVDWSGISDFAALQDDAYGCSTTPWNAATSPASQLIGCSLDQCPEAADATAPAHYANRGDAPMLLMHGREDCFIGPRQSERLYTALQSVGVDVTLRIIDFVGHNDAYWTSAAAFAEVEAFLDAKLKGGSSRRRSASH